MASLLTRRLRCFYCGQRSASKKSTALREWRCDHCEAVNYLDENGDITDPPTSVTDNAGNSNDIHRSPFDSAGFDQTGLFCSKCIRNQHLLMSALSAYFPDPEDPDYAKYEEAYPRYRSKMEDAYPQVCEKCEQKVNERIRQTGYEAKADHLRRTMERSKMSRAAQKARRRNWRNVLATAGAFGYWVSVAGQLLADVIGTADIWDTAAANQRWPSVTTYTTFIKELLPHTGYSSQDISTVALIAGLLSIWWNPQLRHKVKGINGRIVGLNQYYQCQLIVMVARFAIWAWLQDTRDLEPSLPAAVHAFMILFMSVATVFSQRLVQYDTRPLVLWSSLTPVTSPRLQKATAQPASTMNYSNTSFQQGVLQSFPLEKLGLPRENPETNVMHSPTCFSEPDDSMDWTPSVAQEIRPRYVSSRPKPAPEVPPSKSIFQGSLPAAPRPPAWQLRNPIAQKRTEIPTPNVFQTSQSNLQRDVAFTAKSRTPDALFAPPKFFAPSDYQATTGLESLFDQTFTIKSPEDDVKGKTALQSYVREDSRPNLHSIQLENAVRRIFSAFNILPWSIHTVKPSLLPRDATMMGSLILNILMAGFDLLASLNHSSVSIPKVFYSFVKFLATIILAVCLSFNFSGTFHSGCVLELSLRTLTVIHCLEDLVGLNWKRVYPKHAKQTSSSSKLASIPPSTHLSSQQSAEPNNIPQNQHSSPSPPTSPTLSYISNPPSSSFSQSQPYRFNGGVAARDRFTDDGSEISEISGGDSDAKTTTSSYTNKSIRHANVFDRDYRDYQSPRSRGLGSGIQGLSLDDSPLAKRTSRVQRSWGTGLDTEPVRRSRRLR